MCDPLFEDCPETVEPTATQVTEVETEVAADEKEDSKSIYELIYGFSFGVACVLGAYQGATLDWLKSEIEKDTTRYPADVANSRVFDQTWALNTSEPTQWKKAGNYMLASYALSTVLWAANFAIGNNGSTVHRLFYRFSQVFLLVPFFNLVQIYRIKSAYLINNWFEYYDNLGVDKSGTV